MSKQKIDAAAVYFVLQCVADVVRSFPQLAETNQTSEAFLETLREHVQHQDPDMLNPDELIEAKNLHERFRDFVRDPSICLPNLLPSE